MDEQEMHHLDEFDTIFEVFASLAAAQQDEDAKLQELFGDEQSLPDDEAEIVFDFTMTHAEQVSCLKRLRAKKRARTRDMVRRPTMADRGFAQSIGIQL